MMLSQETSDLQEKANEIHLANHGSDVVFGKCIFLSWYCSVGDCTFCYRSTQHGKNSAKEMLRTPASVLTEAILAKELGWSIEFLTGGFGIMELSKLRDLVEKVALVTKEKQWLNLGFISPKQLDLYSSSVQGITASVESVNLKVHDDTCPSKPLSLYEKLMVDSKEKGMKRSACFVLGIGETKDDLALTIDWIRKYDLNKITVYPLHPIPGTLFSEGPSSDYYIWWLSNLRIAFPSLEIIAGTNVNRVNEVKDVMLAGANGITKFPFLRRFGSSLAKELDQQIRAAGRIPKGAVLDFPEKDWDSLVDSFGFDDRLTQQLKTRLNDYVKKISNRVQLTILN